MTRRNFILSATALAVMRPLGAAQGILGSAPSLKFGVLSDTHIMTLESAETFRRALRHFRAIPSEWTDTADAFAQLRRRLVRITGGR